MAVFYKYEYMEITKNIHPCKRLNGCNYPLVKHFEATLKTVGFYRLRIESLAQSALCAR